MHGSLMLLMVVSQDVLKGILGTSIIGETGEIWSCKQLIGKVNEPLPFGMVKSLTKILGTVEPLSTTVVEIV